MPTTFDEPPTRLRQAPKSLRQPQKSLAQTPTSLAQAPTRIGQDRAALSRERPSPPDSAVPHLSSTALTSSGHATVASAYTSANLPPSLLGTNFPQLTPSEYVHPDSPPQCTGSGQMRTPYVNLGCSSSTPRRCCTMS